MKPVIALLLGYASCVNLQYSEPSGNSYMRTVAIPEKQVNGRTISQDGIQQEFFAENEKEYIPDTVFVQTTACIRSGMHGFGISCIPGRSSAPTQQ